MKKDLGERFLPDLKVMSWNMLSGNPFSREGMEHVQILKRMLVNMDVALLQEVKISYESKEFLNFQRLLNNFY